MNVLDAYYAATIAQLKSNFRADNKSVCLLSLEEMFFAMDAEKYLRKADVGDISKQSRKFGMAKREVYVSQPNISKLHHL